MKIKFFGFLLCLLAANTVCAATVNVNWGTVYSYSSVSQGDKNAAQFNVSIDGNDAYGFCVAPTIGISNKTYQYNFLDWTTEYLEAAWLMDAHAQTAGTINTRAKTVGIQSAIWAAVTNDEGYAPNSGVTGNTEYTDWYNAVPTSFDSSMVAHLEQTYKIMNTYSGKNTYQTLIVKYPSVPVPSAVWILGSGLIGLFGLRTRKQS